MWRPRRRRRAGSPLSPRKKKFTPSVRLFFHSKIFGLASELLTPHSTPWCELFCTAFLVTFSHFLFQLSLVLSDVLVGASTCTILCTTKQMYSPGYYLELVLPFVLTGTCTPQCPTAPGTCNPQCTSVPGTCTPRCNAWHLYSPVCYLALVLRSALLYLALVLPGVHLALVQYSLCPT